MHWIRIDRYFKGDGGRRRDPTWSYPADAVRALRERAVRAGLPGGGDGARHRRPEHDGVQPVHRHAVLLEQLPVQGAAVQLLRLAQPRPARGTVPAPCARACPISSRTSRSTRSRQMQFNPDVTVRMRGVMEKCTYCMQRHRQREDRGEERVLAGSGDSESSRTAKCSTACQQACPTQAIVFGNLNDKHGDGHRAAARTRGRTACWTN